MMVASANAVTWRRRQNAIILIAIAIRLIALAVLSGYPLDSDARSYHLNSLEILNGVRYYPYWPPGLPYYLASWHLVLGPSEFVSEIATLALFVVFILLFRRVLTLLVAPRLVAFGLVILASYPVFIHQAVVPLTQIPVAIGFLGLILCLIPYFGKEMSKRRKVTYAVFLGLTLGAMVLVRPSNALVLVLLPVYLDWRLRSVRVPLIVFASACALICPWLMKASDLNGHFVWINNANTSNLYYGNNPFTPEYKTWWIGSHGASGLTDSARYAQITDSVAKLGHDAEREYETRTAKEFILSYPAKFLVRTLNRINVFFSIDSFTSSAEKFIGFPVWGIIVTLLLDGGFFLALITLTIAFLCFYWKTVAQTPLYLTILFLILVCGAPYWISFAHPVYHTPILPLLLIFALLFVEEVTSRGFKQKWSTHFTRRQKVMFSVSMLWVVVAQIQFVVHMASRF
jgi:hypothetical protein